MDRGAWWAAVHGAAKIWTELSEQTAAAWLIFSDSGVLHNKGKPQIHMFMFLRLSSHIDCHRTLGRFPCAIQYSLSVIYLLYNGVYMFILNS